MIKFKEKFVIVISSVFYLGYLPIASGTVGALVGFVICLFLRHNTLAYFIMTVSVILLGLAVSTDAEHIFKEKDSHKIVIDEVAGYLVTMLFLSNMTVGMMIIGLVLNRIFDILKPFPIRKIEELHGGLGIMLDDVMAGIYSNLSLRLIIIMLTCK